MNRLEKHQPIESMVPDTGTGSNCQSPLLEEWSRNNKDNPAELEAALTPETCSELFDTLAEWNEYLEKHVSYFSERQGPQEPNL